MCVDRQERISGIFAAVATPVLDDGRLDVGTFDRLVQFLLDAGADGICIGGATSEYPHFEAADRKALIGRASERAARDSTLLVGIGAPSMRLVLELGAAALEAGSRALLLPMPMFFRYSQDDLEAFAAAASRALRAPCVLYDLPEFTNPLSPATTLALLGREEFLVGIKDSSGREENLDSFVSARADQGWSLLIGDDRLLRKGLAAGWDGGISGVAGFCPELLVALHRSVRRGDAAEGARLQRLLEELIAQIAIFPAPWGIRLGLECRGLATGPLPLPLSARRREQIAQFRQWFAGWLPRTDLTLAAGHR